MKNKQRLRKPLDRSGQHLPPEASYVSLPTENFEESDLSDFASCDFEPCFAPSPALSDAEQQRLIDLQRRLRDGTYWVSAEDLAPILTEIFFSTRRVQ